jgi:ABC-2 type transport system ATP-binding protein
MVRLENVSKSFGSEKAVNSLSLSVKKGIVFGFLGPNGAGKTTTIKMLVGLSSPDEGIITVGERNPCDISLKSRLGFMPENPSFYDYLTGLEFLKFMHSLSGASLPINESSEENTRSLNRRLKERSQKISDEYFLEILKKMGLAGAEHKMIRHYSKGMRQRLAFAQAVVHDPEYLFLDEPLDGLDPIGRREIKRIILDLNQRGKTIFFNSHILSDVEEICDEIGIIHRGKLLYAGGVNEFCKGKPLEEQFVQLIEKNSA